MCLLCFEQIFYSSLTASICQLTHPVGAARSNHPCHALSKWRKFAFSAKEGDRAVHNVPIFEALFDEEVDTYISVKLNGHLRTVVRDLAFEDGSAHPLEFNKEYEMCNIPQEFESGSFWLRIKDVPACQTNNRCPCQALSNPLVHFYADSGTFCLLVASSLPIRAHRLTSLSPD